MKTRMLRFVVIVISRLVLLLALFDRRASEPAGEDFEAGNPAELAVEGEIALPELAWLQHQPPEPLHARHLNPVRRTLDEAGEHVEAAADADDHGYLEPLAMTFHPCLLEGRGHADEQHVRVAGPDFLDDARVVARAEVAVAE